MNKLTQQRNFSVKIDPEAPVYIISVVSEIVSIPIWTLRKLDDLDVVKPKRIGKKTRCYSQSQVEILNYVHYLMEEKRVNISGIRMILQIEKKV
ncbi:MAG: MerR family transcriptional regulator [Candidatus Omnitrophica bacterium]|nr:MerR family transcriptional regulator [Candidatus Omnitrophota bacterium]